MTAATVRRRHVFFFNGFDPKGGASAHGLYRAQAALQGGVTGVDYAVGTRARRDNGNSVWQVRGNDRGVVTDTTFEAVRWDDIVRAHWPRTALGVLSGSVRGYVAALASFSALRKVWQHSRRTLVSLAYPLVFWFAALIGGLLAGMAAASLASRWMPDGFALGTGVAAALGLWWGVLRWERELNTSWLLRIYQFAGDWRHGRTPQVAQRTTATAADVVRALQDPANDEVLLVGYSVGSMLAASTAAHVQQLAQEQGIATERLTLMTLGHCIPLLGLMAGADAYRAELARLGRDPHIFWVDFSSPTDWGSFALVDPLAICLGPADAGRPHAPTMLSPRFHTMFAPAVYTALAADKRRIHLQYIMAGERPALYDFFAITAGPQRLAGRLAAPPSP